MFTYMFQVLNDKFSGEIEKPMLDTFPDQYFTCQCQMPVMWVGSVEDIVLSKIRRLQLNHNVIKTIVRVQSRNYFS